MESLFDRLGRSKEQITRESQGVMAIAQSESDSDSGVLEEVQQKEGLFGRTKREFLIVKGEQFKDYRIYVSARAYGKSLDCCWFLTVEPGIFKKMIAGKLADGDWAAMSAPKNLLLEQDLRAWTTTVHIAVRGAVESLFDRLGRPKDQITCESQGVMSVA